MPALQHERTPLSGQYGRRQGPGQELSAGVKRGREKEEGAQVTISYYRKKEYVLPDFSSA